MAATLPARLTLLLLLVPFVLGDTIEEYDFENYCSRTLDIGLLTSSLKITLSKLDLLFAKKCGVKLTASLRSERIYVQFPNIDIDCSNSLQFYDGPSDSSPELGSEICGQRKPTPIRSSDKDLYIEFTRTNTFAFDEFTLLINYYHGGPCESYEFKCNNGWCIDNDLYCNGNDNCGDNSDYCYRDYNWWIWLLVGIASFIIICVVITVICCCFCKKSTRGTVINTNDQPVVHYQNGTQTVTHQANPWYGAPPQQPQGTYPPAPGPFHTGQVMYPPPPVSQAQVYPNGSSVYPPPKSDDPSSAPPSYTDIMNN